jgi:hypothetical protein
MVRLAGAAGGHEAAGAGAPDGASVVAGLERLLAGAGAAVRLDAGELVLELPTIVELRARGR